jgi:TatA/E family protein of Tat protein translocase
LRPRYNLGAENLKGAGRRFSTTGITFLLILDSVGNTELLLILGAALVFFGPRRLPQLSRQIGRSLSEFRRASDDFKRTWEREVNLENGEKGLDSPAEASIFDKASDRIRSAREAVAGELNFEDPETSATAPLIAPVDPSLTEPRGTTSQPEATTTEQPKHEWL